MLLFAWDGPGLAGLCRAFRCRGLPLGQQVAFPRERIIGMARLYPIQSGSGGLSHFRWTSAQSTAKLDSASCFSCRLCQRRKRTWPHRSSANSFSSEGCGQVSVCLKAKRTPCLGRCPCFLPGPVGPYSTQSRRSRTRNTQRFSRNGPRIKRFNSERSEESCSPGILRI
jgi:hypothetical protein